MLSFWPEEAVAVCGRYRGSTCPSNSWRWMVKRHYCRQRSTACLQRSDADSILIVTQETHAKGEAYHALLPYQALYEPIGRNTAPAIAIAAAYLMAEGADPVMVVLPADHIIKDEVRFRAHLDIAIKAAQNGKLVTFGIQPTRPDTGFGYIKAHRAQDAEVYDGRAIYRKTGSRHRRTFS